MSSSNSVNYTDFVLGFSEHPIKKELGVLENEAAIKQSLRNLVQTNFYERRFQPQVGCGIRSLLFENITPIVAGAIEDAIRVTISNFEPRVNLLDVIADPDPDENFYAVTIIFSLLNSSQPIELPVILYRVR